MINLLIAILVIYYSAWLIIYLVTGLFIGGFYVNPLTFSFKFYHVYYSSKDASIKLGSLLYSNKRFIISDLVVKKDKSDNVKSDDSENSGSLGSSCEDDSERIESKSSTGSTGTSDMKAGGNNIAGSGDFGVNSGHISTYNDQAIDESDFKLESENQTLVDNSNDVGVKKAGEGDFKTSNEIANNRGKKDAGKSEELDSDPHSSAIKDKQQQSRFEESAYSPDSSDDLHSADFSIYPSSNFVSNIIQFFVKIIPLVSIEFRQTKVQIEETFLFDINLIRFSILSKIKEQNDLLKFNLDFIINNLSSNLKINLTNLKVSSSFKIDLNLGRLQNIGLKCFSNEFELSVFNIIKQFAGDVNWDNLGLLEQMKSVNTDKSDGVDHSESEDSGEESDSEKKKEHMEQNLDFQVKQGHTDKRLDKTVSHEGSNETDDFFKSDDDNLKDKFLRNDKDDSSTDKLIDACYKSGFDLLNSIMEESYNSGFKAGLEGDVKHDFSAGQNTTLESSVDSDDNSVYPRDSITNQSTISDNKRPGNRLNSSLNKVLVWKSDKFKPNDDGEIEFDPNINDPKGDDEDDSKDGRINVNNDGVDVVTLESDDLSRSHSKKSVHSTKDASLQPKESIESLDPKEEVAKASEFVALEANENAPHVNGVDPEFEGSNDSISKVNSSDEFFETLQDESELSDSKYLKFSIGDEKESEIDCTPIEQNGIISSRKSNRGTQSEDEDENEFNEHQFYRAGLELGTQKFKDNNTQAEAPKKSFFRWVLSFFFDDKKRVSKPESVRRKFIDSPNESFNKLVNLHNKVYNLVDSFLINLENAAIKDIPFITRKHTESINQYFKGEKPDSCLSLKITSFSFSASKMTDHNSGFSLLFNPNDQPFHITSNLQLLSINYIINCDEHYINQEILNVPNFAITFKSNIGDNLSRGSGFKKSVIEFFASTSSPILDLSTAQLSDLGYNLILILKYQYLKKLIKKQNLKGGVKPKDDKPKIIDIVRENLIQLLQDYYPRFDARIIVEQPRLLIHHDSSPAVFNMSYDLLDFQIFTTKNWQYHAKCVIVNSLSNVYEYTVPRYPIFNAKSVTLDLNLLSNLRVKASLVVDAVTFNFSELATLSLVNELLSDIKQHANELNDTGIKKIPLDSMIDNCLKMMPKKKNTESAESKPKPFFKQLPAWFLSFDFTIKAFNLYLGSRSILIPKQDLFKIEGPEFQDFRGENRELRNVKVSYNKFQVLFINTIKEKPSSKISNQSHELLPTLSSLETLHEEEIYTFWKVNSRLSEFDVSVVTRISKKAKHEVFFSLPVTNLDIFSQHSKTLKVDLKLDEFFANYDRFKLFIFVGAFHVMNHMIVSPIKKALNKFELNKSHDSVKKEKSDINDISKKIDFLHCTFSINKLDFEIRDGTEFALKLQFQGLAVCLFEEKVHAFIEATRVLTISPVMKNYWARLLYVDSLNAYISLKNLKDPEILITSNLITLFHPHQFVAYKLFDNLSVVMKVIKYFVQVISNHDEMDKVSSEVYPKVLKPIKLPFINLKSKQLSYRMEDDPFESELNMIYQLGIIEQRKRLELMSLFEVKLASDLLDRNVPEGLDEKLYNLRENFSRSWIRKVILYKTKLQNEVIKSKKFLYGNESTFGRKWNEGVVPHSIFAPLFLLHADRLDINISLPEFDLKELPKYLHKVGQGIPEETKFSLLVPMFVKLKLSQARVHLRDYPLPFVHVPRPNASDAGVIIKGNFVIAEEFEDNKEQLRHLHVPFVPGKAESTSTKYYSLGLNKSLSTVKIYTDLKINFNTDFPSRFVVGCAYEFAILQVMLNFDSFSKPPVDPSDALGIWDKLRLIMHGSLTIKVKKNLEVAFKGSRDPYNMFTKDSGFILSFSDNIVWTVNGTDDSRDFMHVSADRVSWYMPNFLASPLPCWTRDTSKGVYLPASSSFITSCFGYYLDDGVDPKLKLKVESVNIIDRMVIQLSGGVEFKVGFLLQRNNDKGERINDAKPHYDVKLFNPEYTDSNHDSFDGFRSEYISMMISMKANKDSNYNSIHLNSSVFTVIFQWWKLFDSNMKLPIRNGSLFQQKKSSPKFSTHLLNNIFEFHVKSLFASHTFRDDLLEANETDIVECFGLRGKMDEFICDIHQKREPKKIRHEGLSKSKQVNKMVFHIGEIHLGGIDLRVIRALFNQDMYGNYTQKKSKQDFETFDDDDQWYDLNDYGISGAPDLDDSPGRIKIYPLLFAQKFTYIRDSSADEEIDEALKILSDSSIHECSIHSKNQYVPRIELIKDRVQQLEANLESNKSNSSAIREANTVEIHARIDSLNSELAELEQKASKTKEKLEVDPKVSLKENFDNKFTLISAFVKWNVDSRDATLKYIHHFQTYKSMRYFASYESINVIEDMIQNKSIGDDISTLQSAVETARQSFKFKDNTNYDSSKSRMDNYNDVLRDIEEFEAISEDFLIEVINPQIQLQSDDDKVPVIIIAAPTIDSKIISIYDKKDHAQYANSKVLETRFCCTLNDASIFVLNRNLASDQSGLVINNIAYGSKTNWPPFLGIEVCRNGRLAGKDTLLVEKLAVMVTFDKISPLGLVASKKGADLDFDKKDIENDPSTNDVPSNKLRVDIPRMVITSTSEQYFALFKLVIGLLSYTDSASKLEQEKLEKLKFSVDFHDYRVLQDRIKVLLAYFSTLNILERNYHFKMNKLNNEDLNDYILLKSERASLLNEIYMLMMSILKGENYSESSASNLKDNWTFRADDLTLHLLQDDRSPLMDVVLTDGTFIRNIYEDGSNKNKLVLGSMDAYNLLSLTKYKQAIGPYTKLKSSSDTPLIAIDWTLNRTIGGIRIIENLEAFLEPLTIQLDEDIVNKLLKFTVQADLDNLLDISLPNMGDESDNESEDTRAKEKEKEKEAKEKEKASKDSGKSIGYRSRKSGSSGSEDLQNIHEEDVEKMITRSQQYVTIIKLKLNSFKLNISVDLNKGYKRMLNVQDFVITIDPITVTDETLSFMELGDIVKSAVIKTLLGHTGKLIKNKFTVKKKRSQKFVSLLKTTKSNATTIKTTEL